MATRGGNRGDNGNTRIRFIMLEADGNAADLQQIAQAITSAVRPTVIQIPAQQPMPALPHTPNHAIEATLEVPASEDPAADNHASQPRKASGNGQKRKLPVPTVLDLDLTSGAVPFAQFVQEKNPGDHTKRYLVIAAWLKEQRQIDEININHIYTCYRKLNLNVVPDVAGVLRGAKKQGWFHAGSQPGLYAINHIGLGQVNSMGRSE